VLDDDAVTDAARRLLAAERSRELGAVTCRFR
jgi:hypothetical protein